jgi:hypothetical protein
MRFARVRRAAVMLAAAHFLFSTLPARCQNRSLRAFTAERPAAPFPRDLPECAGEAERRAAFLRPLATHCNSPAPVFPQDAVRLRLLSLGSPGLAIEQAREHVMSILRSANSCSDWFQEADPRVLATFQSLDFSLDNGPKYVLTLRSAEGEIFLKHPYSARVEENAGPNATILLNANGAFFVETTYVVKSRIPGAHQGIVGHHTLSVGSYMGNTLPARITTLLHELGHVTGRLPDDSDELVGLSMKNTERVLHACRAEIKASARQHLDNEN